MRARLPSARRSTSAKASSPSPTCAAPWRTIAELPVRIRVAKAAPAASRAVSRSSSVAPRPSRCSHHSWSTAFSKRSPLVVGSASVATRREIMSRVCGLPSRSRSKASKWARSSSERATPTSSARMAICSSRSSGRRCTRRGSSPYISLMVCAEVAACQSATRQDRMKGGFPTASSFWTTRSTAAPSRLAATSSRASMMSVVALPISRAGSWVLISFRAVQESVPPAFASLLRSSVLPIPGSARTTIAFDRPGRSSSATMVR